MTSVRKRPEPPRRLGGVMPLWRSGSGAGARASAPSLSGWPPSPTDRRCGRFSESMGKFRRGGGRAGAKTRRSGSVSGGLASSSRTKGGSRAGASGATTGSGSGTGGSEAASTDGGSGSGSGTGGNGAASGTGGSGLGSGTGGGGAGEETGGGPPGEGEAGAGIGERSPAEGVVVCLTGAGDPSPVPYPGAGGTEGGTSGSDPPEPRSPSAAASSGASWSGRSRPRPRHPDRRKRSLANLHSPSERPLRGLSYRRPRPAAARMASSGAGTPVQRSKLSAPWRTSTSRPSTTRPPTPRAAEIRAVSRAP